MTSRVSKYNFVLLGAITLLSALLMPFSLWAQKEKKHIYDGNTFYGNKNYTEAEKQYSTALTKNKDSYKAAFNLGDAYYQQGKYEEAAGQFQALTHKATSKDTLAKAYHNLGNTFLKAKKYQEAVDAYKQALKNDPKDEDTRYNLAYAQQYLKQQQNQQKKNDQNKDKEKDEKNKDDKENKDKKDKKEDKKEDDKKKDQEKNDQKTDQQKNQISKEDAERLLEALQNDERKLQEKKKAKKVKGSRVEVEKDW
ncbi:MAG: tetratricopeptide repeat protein [Bacteroidetes bacterium]|nr:tetratricopeptide repeat protein [Bacteroidota bacterium]